LPRAGLLLCATLSGCLAHVGHRGCPQGQQLSEGQCVPTSSIVFERCIDSFRKTSTESDEGVDTRVGAKVANHGGSLEHKRTDRASAQYDALPVELVPEAIAECRRQERTEREQQVQRAWDAAREALARADRAERMTQDARKEAEQSQAAIEEARAAQAEAEQGRAELEASLAQLRAEHDAQLRLWAENHPCTVQDWYRCGLQALEAKRKGDYELAHELYSQSCEGGDALACANWGVMFEHGLGVAASTKAALERYARGCEQGNVLGCLNEGRMLELQSSGSRDDEVILQRYRLACDAEIAAACAGLGRLYELGRGVDADPKHAAELFERACDAGERTGCEGLERLSRRWESGEGGV